MYSVGAKFGHIPGYPVGTVWKDRYVPQLCMALRCTQHDVARKALAASSVHPPPLSGIYGRKATGARSVVLAGRFDDEDHGDHLCVHNSITSLRRTYSHFVVYTSEAVVGLRTCA